MTVKTSKDFIYVSDLLPERLSLIHGAKCDKIKKTAFRRYFTITFDYKNFPVCFTYFFKEKTFYIVNTIYAREFVAYLIMRGL